MAHARDSEALLTDLDRVDWSATWDAYGPAKKVPKHLRALASPDPQVQDGALDELAYTIYHQGSVYPASVEAVPFLAELLRSPQVRRKRPVLEILQLLAGGRSYVENHEDLKIFQDAVARDPKFKARLEAERRVVPALHARIREHLGTYLAILNDEQAETRLHATALLVALPDLANETMPALEKLALGDADGGVRANAILALARLGPETAIPVFLDRVAAEEGRDALVHAAALAMLASFAPDGVAPDQLEVLHALLRDAPESLRNHYRELPCGGRFEDDIAISLASAGRDDARRVLSSLTALHEGERYLPDETLVTLLHLAELSDGPLRPPPREFTPLQRAAIRIVADCAWPKPMHTFANAVDVLEAFGLPGDEHAVRRLVAGAHWRDVEPPKRNQGQQASPPDVEAPSRTGRRWYQFWKR